jgi:hypothetical protein
MSSPSRQNEIGIRTQIFRFLSASFTCLAVQPCVLQSSVIHLSAHARARLPRSQSDVHTNVIPICGFSTGSPTMKIAVSSLPSLEPLGFFVSSVALHMHVDLMLLFLARPAASRTRGTRDT